MIVVVGLLQISSISLRRQQKRNNEWIDEHAFKWWQWSFGIGDPCYGPKLEHQQHFSSTSSNRLLCGLL
jgi:hypothetical protein